MIKYKRVSVNRFFKISKYVFLTATQDFPRVFDAEEISELAIVVAIMNDDVCDLSWFE